jgi:sulfur relay (sulfurtransferase) DsrF/TusC family protein
MHRRSYKGVKVSMENEKMAKDLGFILTKAPLESPHSLGILNTALGAVNSGRSVALFLLSDGVWLAKKNQNNRTFEVFQEILAQGAEVTASKEHLEAAGIPPEDLVQGVTIADKPYDALVEKVMEDWKRVMVI